MNPIIKKLLPHVAALTIIILYVVVYVAPQYRGESLNQSDMISYSAKVKQIRDHEEATGETVYWNPSQFSGMPDGLLKYGYKFNQLRFFKKPLSLFQDRPSGLLIRSGICAYLGIILIGISPWIALIVGLAYAVNVNFLVLLDAGHISKLHVISYFPMIICGLISALRDKSLVGTAVFGLGLSLAIMDEHIQMVYYLALMLVPFTLIYLAITFKEKSWTEWGKILGLLLLVAILSALSNFKQLKGSREYAASTMRGEPILETNAEVTSSSEVQGLEWNYAMNWSNTFLDLMSFWVPGIVGGSSGEAVDAQSDLGQLMRGNGAPVVNNRVNVPLYWGGMPSTSGPYYIGAGIVFLFVLSMFFINPAFRFPFIFAALLCMLLSMGKHASWLNRPLFDHLPLFNAFRAPNSVMSLFNAIILIPVAMGLQAFLNSDDKDKQRKALFYSLGICGGVILVILSLGASNFDYLSDQELSYAPEIQSIFVEARAKFLQNDSLRALAFTLIAFAILFAFQRGALRNKATLFALLIAAVAIDTIPINKRYVTWDSFSNQRVSQQAFEPRAIDDQIHQLEPKGRGHYRVLDLSVNTWNSSIPSIHHNTIGGYDPAKLQRYQDIIVRQISSGNAGVLDMLNTKYVISREGQLQVRNSANGPAWFIENLNIVNTPNQEIDQLTGLNTKSEAIILTDDFPEYKTDRSFQKNGSIELLNYEPAKLTYSTNSSSDQFAVFSEVWYDDGKNQWQAYIDGKPVSHTRVNYILRGMNVPAGQHNVEFVFSPDKKGRSISLISSLLLTGLVLYGLIFSIDWSNLSKPLPEKKVVISQKVTPKKKVNKTSKSKSSSTVKKKNTKKKRK